VLRSSAVVFLVVCASCATRGPQSPPVVPGISLSADRAALLDTIVYRRSITRGGVDSAAGTRTVVQRVIARPDGARFLEVEQRFPANGGEIVDTAVAELSTLRAVSHRSHQPTRTMRFDFAEQEALGTVMNVGAGSGAVAKLEPVQQNIGGPIFDSNVIELVIAALPLSSGFHAELPFFIYERGGRVPMSVAVRERTRAEFSTLGTREAWVVTVGVPDAPATVWVDAETRAVLRVRYDIAARGMSFTDDRVTPLKR
jgi:hypothetical protein